MSGWLKPRWFTRPQTIVHPSTNRVRRRVTSLIETNVLPLSQAATKPKVKASYTPLSSRLTKTKYTVRVRIADFKNINHNEIQKEHKNIYTLPTKNNLNLHVSNDERTATNDQPKQLLQVMSSKSSAHE